MDIDQAFTTSISPVDNKQNTGLVDHIREPVGSASRYLDAFENTTHKNLDARNGKAHHFQTTFLAQNRARTPVSDLFFSDMNIKALQEGIRYTVFKRSPSQKVIGDQSVNELLVIMRYMYNHHHKNLPYHIVEQVREINGHVIDKAVKNVLSELSMYDRYLQDKSSLHTKPFDPMFTSTKGDKTLELTKNFI